MYHRSYEEREPIEVRIYEEEMIILSYPGPDRSVQIEAFEKGRVNSRRYRNRRIGEFFKDLRMTEGRSTGIKKIIDSMTENTSPKPIFDFDEEHTYFQVTLPVHQEVLKKVSMIEENTPPPSHPPSHPPSLEFIRKFRR